MFAIDLERRRVLAWSIATDGWELLASDDAIVDDAFVLPLRAIELVSTATADNAVARALLAKRKQVLDDALAQRHAEGRAEGQAEALAAAIVEVLVARRLPLPESSRAVILRMRDAATLARWLPLAATCSTLDELVLPRGE